MTRRTRVGLVFGGASVEHEVSVISARGVRKALDASRFECVPIGVTEEGRWLAPEPSLRVLECGAARVESAGHGGELLIAPGRGILAQQSGGLGPLEIQVVFPLIHGWGGEDGRLQGLLDLAGIPYVGAGVSGSAAGMDKETAKILCSKRGIPVTPWVVASRAEYRTSPSAARDRITAALRFPIFVKPANGGSSVGVTKVKSPDQLGAALDVAFECDGKAIAETGIDAREIECAVLGNDAPEASVLGEIVPSGEFYDYASKYLDGASQLKIPAPIPESKTEEIRGHAVAAFQALGLAGLARIDFFLDRGDGAVYVNEANTLPGFTPISMYPKLWEASGLPYTELLSKLLDLAVARGTSERARATRYTG